MKHFQTQITSDPGLLEKEQLKQGVAGVASISARLLP
jgi:hypothetical protein